MRCLEHLKLMEILNAVPKGAKSSAAKMLDDSWDGESELATAGLRTFTEEKKVCFTYKVTSGS